MHTLSFTASIAKEFNRKIVARGQILVHAEKLCLQQRKIELAPSSELQASKADNL